MRNVRYVGSILYEREMRLQVKVKLLISMKGVEINLLPFVSELTTRMTKKSLNMITPVFLNMPRDKRRHNKDQIYSGAY